MVSKSCVRASDASKVEGHTCGHELAILMVGYVESETLSKHPEGMLATCESVCALKLGWCAHVGVWESFLACNGSGALTALMFKGATLDVVVCNVNAGGEASRIAPQGG